MLAAECTCAMLSAEHSVLRQTLSALAEAMHAEPGPSLTRVRMLIEFVDVFEHGCHRPKEASHLLPALKGKSRDADRLIAALEDAHACDDGLLERAFVVLRAIEKGDSSRLAELQRALDSHRESMLSRLAQEDDTLFALARRHLSVDEWSRVASGVSRVAYPAGALYVPDRGTPATEPADVEVAHLLRNALWQAPAANALRH